MVHNNQPRKSVLRLILRPIGLILFGVTFALLVAEVWLRIMAGFGLVSNQLPDDLFAWNPYGWTLHPNSVAIVDTIGGRIRIEANSLGFRDREYPLGRIEDSQRFLIIGDSFTAAFETPDEAIFHEILETRHSESSEFISLAASGYGLSQYLNYYKDVGRQFSPDVVIIMLYVGNDIPDHDELRDMPHYEMEDGQLMLVNFPNPSPENQSPFATEYHSTPLMKRSALAFLIGQVVKSRQLEDKITSLEPCALAELTTEALPDDSDWLLTESLLMAIHQNTLADGAELRIVLIPMELQVEPDKYLLDHCTDYAELVASYSPQERLTAFLDDEAIPYLDLLDTFRNNVDPDTPLYFPGIDNHLTPAGHLLAANMLDLWLFDGE